MVAFNVSTDDASPLISYSPVGAWTDSPCNDLSAMLYSQQSWHTSSSYGASATFHFNGTGIWFFGARRPDYGPYNISIDGHSVSGNAQSQELSFQQLLGGRSGLSNGPHTAVFTNTGSGSFIDLDSIVFETETGSADSAVMTQTTMDDTSPAITYLPSQEDWIFDNMQGWFNDTLHFTQTAGAQAQFTFVGDAVAIYGTVSPFLADYAVTTDGVTQCFQSRSQGLASNVHMDILLYFASSLTSGPHNLTLTANPRQSGQYNTGTLMDIDRIVVFNASNVTTTEDDHGNFTLPTIIGLPQKPVGHIPLTGLQAGSQNDTNSANNATQGYIQQHSSKRHKIAVIGGGIAGVVLLILLILMAFLLFRRRRPQKHSLCCRFSVRPPRTPNLPMQPPPAWKISSPICASDSYDLDLESIIAPYTIPLGPDDNSSLDDAHVTLPWLELPETCVTRDASDGRQGEFQVQSKAWPKAPIRRLRPPSLNLAPLRG